MAAKQQEEEHQSFKLKCAAKNNREDFKRNVEEQRCRRLAKRNQYAHDSARTAATACSSSSSTCSQHQRHQQEEEDRSKDKENNYTDRAPVEFLVTEEDNPVIQMILQQGPASSFCAQ
jgi:hypothetical protein